MSARHHPIFSHFHRQAEYTDGQYHYNFLGGRIRGNYENPHDKKTIWSSGRSVHFAEDRTYPYQMSEDYFEWIEVLQAAQEAKGTFTMIDLGAGYGRWGCNGGLAARHRLKGPLPARLGFVELHAGRCAWIREHLHDNGLNPDEHVILNGAVGGRAGEAVACQAKKAESAYGQSATFILPGVSVEGHSDVVVDEDMVARKLNEGWTRIRAYSLAEVITLVAGEEGVVDIIDMDVQGAEAEAIAGAIDVLCARVKRLHIATHSREIENDILGLLPRRGWKVTRYLRRLSKVVTEFGPFETDDGIIACINGALKG